MQMLMMVVVVMVVVVVRRRRRGHSKQNHSAAGHHSRSSLLSSLPTGEIGVSLTLMFLSWRSISVWCSRVRRMERYGVLGHFEHPTRLCASSGMRIRAWSSGEVASRRSCLKRSQSSHLPMWPRGFMRIR